MYSNPHIRSEQINAAQLREQVVIDLKNPGKDEHVETTQTRDGTGSGAHTTVLCAASDNVHRPDNPISPGDDSLSLADFMSLGSGMASGNDLEEGESLDHGSHLDDETHLEALDEDNPLGLALDNEADLIALQRSASDQHEIDDENHSFTKSLHGSVSSKLDRCLSNN